MRVIFGGSNDLGTVVKTPFGGIISSQNKLHKLPKLRFAVLKIM